jgi:hypothetical protein
MKSKIAVVALGVALSGCATEYSMSPVPQASQQIRYERGEPTLYSEHLLGVVQVTPVKVTDDMRLAFGIAAFNKSGAPSNFGVENISLAEGDGTADKIFTSGELIHEAKVKAAWATFATALAGGLAAANSYSTTTATAYTPEGSVSLYARTYDPAQAAEARAETRENLAAIQNSLDRTISGINGSVLQTTTVNPGDSYGGIVVADKLDSSRYPQTVSLHIAWNGEDHAFKFIIAEGPPQVPQGAPASLPVEALPPSQPAAMPMTAEQKLPYGYADNGARPDTTVAAQPRLVSFDHWSDKKPKAK